MRIKIIITNARTGEEVERYIEFVPIDCPTELVWSPELSSIGIWMN